MLISRFLTALSLSALLASNCYAMLGDDDEQRGTYFYHTVQELEKRYKEGKSYPSILAEAAKLYETAAESYERAAEHGHTKTQHYLAMCFAEGKGVDQDHARAIELFRRAADQECAPSQYNLALYYEGKYGAIQETSQKLSVFISLPQNKATLKHQKDLSILT